MTAEAKKCLLGWKDSSHPRAHVYECEREAGHAGMHRCEDRFVEIVEVAHGDPYTPQRELAGDQGARTCPTRRALTEDTP